MKGIAAALLPFDDRGAVAVEAFQDHLLHTHSTGLTNAVNMDTGYVNYLSEDAQQLVLKWTRAAAWESELMRECAQRLKLV